MINIKKINLVIIAIACLVYAALITFQPSVKFMPKTIVWYMDQQRLLELALLIIVFIESMFGIFVKKNSILISKPLVFCTIFITVLSSLSIYQSISPRHAILETCTFIGLFYLAGLIARLYIHDEAGLLRKIILLLWTGLLLYLMSFYTGYISAISSHKPLVWPQPFTGFSNIRSFNQYQLWSIGLITIPLICFNLTRTIRALLHVAIILWWILLFYSASRGVLIALLTAIIITGLVYRGIAWSFLKLQVVYMALGAVGFHVLFRIFPAINQSTITAHNIVRSNTDDRLALWSQAISMIKNHPFFGAGPMHFAWYNTTNGHPHNSILQLGSEFGIPVTIICICVGVYCLWCWLKKFSYSNLQASTEDSKIWAIILLFTTISNFTYSLVDGVIVMPISQVLMFTVLGIMLGQFVKTNNNAISNYKTIYRGVISAVVLVLICWSSYPEIKSGLSGGKFSIDYAAKGSRYWFVNAKSN